MTVTSYEASAEAQEYVLQDDQGPITLYGEVIADLSWSYDTAYEIGHTRWTDITLYRNMNPESSTPYVIQVIGRSVVYHRHGGPCHKGVSSPVGRLRRDTERYNNLAPCHIVECAPTDLDDLGDGDIVSAEEDIYTLHQCADAAAVVEVLQKRGSRGTMSKLNVKLLQAASRSDDAIAAALMRTRRL